MRAECCVQCSLLIRKNRFVTVRENSCTFPNSASEWSITSVTKYFFTFTRFSFLSYTEWRVEPSRDKWQQAATLADSSGQRVKFSKKKKNWLWLDIFQPTIQSFFFLHIVKHIIAFGDTAEEVSPAIECAVIYCTVKQHTALYILHSHLTFLALNNCFDDFQSGFWPHHTLLC